MGPVEEAQVTPFERALDFTLSQRIEGGKSNHPLDRGGYTNNGFTQSLYDAWRVTTGKPKRSVDLIDDDEKIAIARDEFWLPCKCDQMPLPIAVALFDMAFNSGRWNAKITLQKALGVKQDGVVGAITIRAAHATPNALLRYLQARGGYIQEVITERPSQVAFLEGWISRYLLLLWEFRA